LKFADVRLFALTLPEVSEEPHHTYSSFRVRGKIFMTVPPGEQLIHVFIGEQQRDQALAMYPSWTEKLFWGGKAVGLRLTLVAASSGAVLALVRAAWQLKAPAALRIR
jgi:hypothetical protein